MTDRDGPFEFEGAKPDSGEEEAAGPSRRAFLGRAAALAAGAAGLGAFAPGCSFVPGISSAAIPRARSRPELRPDQPIRMGIIGTGGMGTSHGRAFARLAADDHAAVEVRALCDICLPRLENAVEEITERQPGVEVATHTDYRELLNDPTLHGVLIATPEHWHAKMAEDAIAAGKDVYVEKPMTLGLDEAIRLRQVVEANPEVRFLVGTQHIMYPGYQEARKRVAEGVIGVPVSSQTSYCRNSEDGEWTYYEIDPDWDPQTNLDWEEWCGPLGRRPWDPKVYARWRRYRTYSTGIIGDLLVHRIVPMMQALDPGWPVRVVAAGGHLVDKDMENHDQVNLTIEFESGHIMSVLGSTANEVGLETMIRGHRANLYVADRRLTLRPERIYAEGIEPQTWDEPDSGNAHDALRLHWLDIIRTRDEPISDIELNLKAMVIVDLAARSMWEGQAFRFEPGRERARAI